MVNKQRVNIMNDNSKLIIGGVLLFIGGTLIADVIESEDEIDNFDYNDGIEDYDDYDEIDEQ